MRRQHGLTILELLGIILAVAIVIFILLPVFRPMHRGTARQSVCTNNQRQLVTAIQMYAQDNHDQLPAASTIWSVIHLDADVLKCPSSRTGGYGYNRQLDARKLETIPDELANHLLVTADSPQPNSLLNSPADIAPRHSKKYLASFLDGHVELVGKTTVVKWK